MAKLREDILKGIEARRQELKSSEKIPADDFTQIMMKSIAKFEAIRLEVFTEVMGVTFNVEQVRMFMARMFCIGTINSVEGRPGFPVDFSDQIHAMTINHAS